MSKLNIQFEETKGIIKPMHAVNNGPVYKWDPDQRNTNLEAFKEAGIPYVRNHDAAFYSAYGSEHTVDITAIFPDFDADPYDEKSYDFACTDEYLKVIEYAGAKTFYRLGQKIEHYVKKYGSLPPKDFHKWAIICEHIIRHYNYGWANGFEMGIEYWEIWNEADLDPDDSKDKRTWGGTKAEFFKLYHIAATHLKACFPELKIGGPALAHDLNWTRDFLQQLEAPLDFFSWHRYADDPKKILTHIETIRKLLDENGYTETESILNEWNYVKGWTGDDYLYSLRKIKQLKGSSFTAAAMCIGQQNPLDMLMYYDARPCTWNGMFHTDFVCDKLKGYYPFYAFNVLYQLGTEVKATSDDDEVYVCAAANETDGAVMLTYFNDDDNAESKKAEIAIHGFGSSGAEAEYYLLNDKYDLELIRTETFSADTFKAIVQLENYSTMLLKLKSKKR